MCECIDVEIGSYDNQKMVMAPAHMRPYSSNGNVNWICIDTCILAEILQLWSIGISTTGCCCGHNKTNGYIGVEDKDIQNMLNFGYISVYNKSRPFAKDSFLPKSTKP